MRTEFPEVWDGLMRSEFIICLQAIKRKARMIRTLEREQRHDLTLEEEMLGDEEEDRLTDKSLREEDASNQSEKNNQLPSGIVVDRMDSSNSHQK